MVVPQAVDNLAAALKLAEFGALPVVRNLTSSTWRRSFLSFVDELEGPGTRVAYAGTVGYPQSGELAGLANLFAALTGRKAKEVAFAPANWPEDLAVVFGTVGDVDTRWLSHLAAASEVGNPIGLITGRDVAAVYRASLGAIAGLFVPKPHEPLFLDLLGDARFGVMRAGARILAGGSISPEDSLHLLGAGADLLRIRAHSDGFDASMPGGILCTAKDGEAPAEDAPGCIKTGFCYRVDRPFAALGKMDSLISTTTIKARLAILDMCQSIAPSDLPFAARFALFCKVAEHPTILTALATPDYSVNHDFETDHLSVKITQGQTLGQALSEYYAASGDGTSVRSRFIILGDPEFQLLNTTAKGFVPIEAEFAPLPASVQLRQPSSGKDRAEWAAEIGSAFWGRTIETAVRSLGPPFRIDRSEPCRHCGHSARVMVQHNLRKTVFCLRCGPTFHGPHDRTSPKVGLSDGQISAPGIGVGTDWAGLALCWGYQESHQRAVPWPCLADGRPAPACPLPFDPSVPVRRVGYVFVDDDWQFFSVPAKNPYAVIGSTA